MVLDIVQGKGRQSGIWSGSADFGAIGDNVKACVANVKLHQVVDVLQRYRLAKIRLSPSGRAFKVMIF